MRIAALGLFSHDGERRILRFGEGLNIVTGWSATGKSSVLDVVEFCLGRSDPSYPVGVLTEVVSWFALELEHDGARIVVARPAPESPSTTSSTAMVRFGVGLADVGLDDLAANTDARTLRAELTRLLGIPPNQVRPGSLSSPPLSATASQALLLCLQSQGEVANKAYLFHRANDRDIERAIRSTLPYFVGAIDVDTIALQQELSERLAELRIAELRLARMRIARSREVEGASSLVAEASVLGLVPPEGTANLDAVSQLIALSNADFAEDPEAHAAPSPTVISALRARQDELTGHLSALEHRLGTIRIDAGDRIAYQDELDEQRRRLIAIHILPDPLAGGPEPCPVCGHSSPDEATDTQIIRQDLSDLDLRLGDLRGPETAAADRLERIEGAAARVREELQHVTGDLDAAVRASAELAATRDLRSRRDFVLGRISEFLSALPADDSALSQLEREIHRLQTEVDELAEQLDPDSYRERTESLLRVVSEDVTTWARRLRLGYSDHSIHIDPHLLTVVADTRQGPVELHRMGSAANVMGFHVIAHLAIHKWFLEKSRPVPSFLILDQPSQVFYPDDVRRAEDEQVSDEDRRRITELYTLVRDVIAELDEKLQVIVLDHANLNLGWFQDAVIANWRDGEALVPKGWLRD